LTLVLTTEINFTLQALSCKRHNWKYFDSNLASRWAEYL